MGIHPTRMRSPYTFSFSYDEPDDLSQYHDSDYSFYGTTYWVNDPSRVRQEASSATNIQATIDTNLIIKLLSISYYYSYNESGGPNFTKTEVLKLHDISLKKTGDSYNAVASGSSLKSLIDTVYIQGMYPSAGPEGIDNNQPPMDSLIGFTSSASLSIVIK